MEGTPPDWHQDQTQESASNRPNLPKPKPRTKPKKPPHERDRDQDRSAGPTPIEEILPEAIRSAFAAGPVLLYARVERAIVASCPELAGSWAVPRVARLVADGQLSEYRVLAALEEFAARRRNRALPEVRDPAAYAAALLKKALAREGIPWKNPIRRQASCSTFERRTGT